MEKVKGYSKNIFNSKILNINYIKKNLDKLDFTTICLDFSFIVGDMAIVFCS